MQHEAIAFRGMYRFASRAELERALASAVARIEDDELGDDGDWMRGFAVRGDSLWVDARLTGSADAYLAADVLELLASRAIDGVVESHRGRFRLDWYPSRARP